MKGKALVVVAVLLGVVVVVLINARLSALQEKANPPTQIFYQATADILPGTALRAAVGGKRPLVKEVRGIPEAFAKAQPDLLDDRELEWARDRTIHRPVRAGDFLRMEHLEPLSASEVRARMPEGTVAIAITVTQETSVGFLVGPGDVVDVYLVTTVQDPDAPGGVKAVSRKVGQDMTVFAVDDVLLEDDGTVLRPRGRTYRSVTIADEPQSIERLLEARELGQLQLVLKSKRPGR